LQIISKKDTKILRIYFTWHDSCKFNIWELRGFLAINGMIDNSMDEKFIGKVVFPKKKRIKRIPSPLNPLIANPIPEAKKRRRIPFPERVVKALKFIEKNYSRLITLNEISAYLNIHPSSLCRLFKKATGETLIEHLNRKRIEEAKGLLRNQTLSIREVAQKVGFDSQNYFGIVFKKKVGIPPTHYRRMLTKRAIS